MTLQSSECQRSNILNTPLKTLHISLLFTPFLVAHCLTLPEIPPTHAAPTPKACHRPPSVSLPGAIRYDVALCVIPAGHRIAHSKLFLEISMQ